MATGLKVVAAANKHVVVIEVVVNRAASQLRQQRRNVAIEPANQCVDRGAECRVVDEGAMPGDHVPAVEQIPVEVAMNRGVIEVGERSSKGADAAAKVLDQFACPARRIGECNARHVRDSPDEMCSSVRRDHLGDRVTGEGAGHSRNDVERGADMHQCPLLRLEHRARLERVRELEHESLAACGLQQKVLIALTG